MQLSDLDKPIDELIAGGTPAVVLAELQAELVSEKLSLKRREEVFNAVLSRLYGDQAHTAYLIAKKDTGTVHIPASNSLNLTVDVDKTVVWDQAILRKTLDSMAPEDARHYAKVKLEVGEKEFTAAPPAIKTALQRARTVKPGKMKFTFKVAEAA